LTEGSFWLDRMLSAYTEPSPEHVRLLWLRGWIAVTQGDPLMTLRFLHQCQEEAERIGDEAALPFVWQFAGIAEVIAGDPARGRELLGAAVDFYHMNEEWNSIRALCLMYACTAASQAGEVDQAIAWGEQCRALCEAHGERWTLSYALEASGFAQRIAGNFRKSRQLARESLRIFRDFDNRLGIALAVEALAWVAPALREFEPAARLLGAATQLWRPIGTPLFGWHELFCVRKECETKTRNALGDEAFESAYASGGRLSSDAAIAYALGEMTQRDVASAARPYAPLTRREREIAELVAQGLSNKDIAATLVIAPRTADSHIEHIFTKLGLSSRDQLTAWMAEQAAMEHHSTTRR
jgi:DNA-binding CsgD family transcriptional regulator